MTDSLTAQLQALLAKDPAVTFRESALARKLHQDPRAIAQAVDQLEAAGVAVCCRILRPGQPADRDVRITASAGTKLVNRSYDPATKHLVTRAEHFRRVLAATAKRDRRAETQAKRNASLAARLGADFRPDTGEVRCARCRRWLDQGHYESRHLGQAHNPECQSCRPVPPRRKYDGRARHVSVGV